jgi:plasmid stabilization system protein ParE
VSYTVHIRHDAELDIEEAAFWYEKQREGLGDEFLDQIQAALRLMAENPYMFPIVHRHTRRALIKRFPFGIYFRIEQNSIVVVAVMHGSRHPKRWQRRT